MFLERNILEELLEEIDKSSSELIAFLNEELKKNKSRYTEHDNPTIEISDNKIKTLALNLKHTSDAILKLKSVKRC